jgi:nicotinamidase/pyrazinamidase
MNRVLLVVDGQRDFCEGGALPLTGGNTACTQIAYLESRGCFDFIIATYDSHPEDHQTAFIDWPKHCVKGTPGELLNIGLEHITFDGAVWKGQDPLVDSYSGFWDNNRQKKTALSKIINDLTKNDEFVEIYIAGLATDVCVKFTALDAVEEFPKAEITVIVDACAGTSDANISKACDEMMQAGISLTTVKGYLGE